MADKSYSHGCPSRVNLAAKDPEGGGETISFFRWLSGVNRYNLV